MSDKVFYGTYCDDIRREDNGKLMLIGCYGHMMYVPQFPFTMQRLCVHFVYRSPINTQEKNLIISLKQDGNELTSANVDLEAALNSKDTAKETHKYKLLAGQLDALGLTFQKTSKLELTLTVDGTEVVGPILWVEQPPQLNT